MCGRGLSAREKVPATVTLREESRDGNSCFGSVRELESTTLTYFFWGWIGANDGSALNDCLKPSQI